MLSEKDYALGQILGDAYYVFTRYHDTKLMPHQQRGLNYHFKQPLEFVNKLEFNADGWSIICHLKDSLLYYKHHQFMEGRVIEMRPKPAQEAR